MKTKVVLGGTFSVIHKGHIALLRKAFESGDVIEVGLTSDSYVAKNKLGAIPGYSARRRNLNAALKKMGGNFYIVKINDKYGSTLREDFNTLVVSEETRSTAVQINKLRLKRGMKAVRIVSIKRVLADDGKPISGTRIRNGEIDIDGKVLA